MSSLDMDALLPPPIAVANIHPNLYWVPFADTILDAEKTGELTR